MKIQSGTSARRRLGEGHDLLFIGVEPTVAADGGFDQRRSLMTFAFKGTMAIVSSRGRQPEADKDLRILVPISGTERSTRAAEFGFLVAKATGCAIAVLLHKRSATKISSLPGVSDGTHAHLTASAGIDEIAGYYHVKVQRIIQDGASPERSILRHARKGRYDLIVLSVSRRAGDRLSAASSPIPFLTRRIGPSFSLKRNDAFLPS